MIWLLAIIDNIQQHNYLIRQMLLQELSTLEHNLQRSLDRLAIVSQQITAIPSIPAFYYSANLLNQYARKVGADCVKPHYFATFNLLIQHFAEQDFSLITKNHQKIVDDILEIVDSQLFMDCMRPTIKSTRSRHSTQLEDSPKKSNHFPAKSAPKGSVQSFYVKQNQVLWQRVQQMYSNHKLDQAYSLCLQFMEKTNNKVQLSEQKRRLIQTINLQYNTMVGFYQQFDKGEWQMDQQQNGISLQYKVYEEEKQVAIRIIGETDIALQPFLSIISEIDLMGQYVPFCYDCHQLKVISRNQRIGTSKIYIPVLTDRQTYFYAAGYDRFQEKGSIFLYSKTINQDTLYQSKYQFQVPKQSEFVRLQYKFFIVQYVPLTRKRARIRLASKIDMKMNFLPMFILNKSARIFAFDYFKNILKIAQSYEGSQWEKKVQERPQLYTFFKQQLAQFYKKLQS